MTATQFAVYLIGLPVIAFVIYQWGLEVVRIWPCWTGSHRYMVDYANEIRCHRCGEYL